MEIRKYKNYEHILIMTLALQARFSVYFFVTLINYIIVIIYFPPNISKSKNS